MDEDEDTLILDQQADDVVIEDQGEDEGAVQDAPPQPEDNATIRRMRAQIRELERRNQEALKAAPQSQPVEIGPRPKLEDFDYDEDKHAVAIDAWHDRRFKEQQRQEQEDAKRNAPDPVFAEALQKYEAGKGQLQQPDAATILEETEAALTPVMKAAIVKVADNPAALMYRIGTDAALFDQLEGIADPVRLIAAIARLENGAPEMATKRPQLDVPVTGRAASTETKDKRLAKLEAEAERTGDRTKLIQYRRSLKAA